jgi:Cys-tRNA(Pro)/Cys-tRNA(Cys) deacylase
LLTILLTMMNVLQPASTAWGRLFTGRPVDAMDDVTTDALADWLAVRLSASGVPFTIHEHAPSVTIRDADEHLDFPVERLVKTIAFRVKNQGWLLVGLCAYDQADYRKLADFTGVSRDKISRVEPEELREALGYAVGGTAPFAPNEQTRVVLDRRILQHATIFCGTGRLDRTLEIAPDDLVRLSGAAVASLAKKPVCEG